MTIHCCSFCVPFRLIHLCYKTLCLDWYLLRFLLANSSAFMVSFFTGLLIAIFFFHFQEFPKLELCHQAPLHTAARMVRLVSETTIGSLGLCSSTTLRIVQLVWIYYGEKLVSRWFWRREDFENTLTALEENVSRMSLKPRGKSWIDVRIVVRQCHRGILARRILWDLLM